MIEKIKDPVGKEVDCDRYCPHCGKQHEWKKYEFFDNGYRFFCRCSCGSESGWLNSKLEYVDPHPSFLRYVEAKAREINGVRLRGFKA
jgi:hypothetical protein